MQSNSNLQLASSPITILDGGMGSELIHKGAASASGLWSAAPLLNDPDSVVETHLDYITAGADVITTNSYSTIPSYLEKQGIGKRYPELTALAGQLATRAVQRSSSKIRIAGCIPPLDESYRPDLVRPAAEIKPVYMNLTKALMPYVDCFLCETMSSIAEATVAIQAVKSALGDIKRPIWVAFTLKESASPVLRSGESIESAARAVVKLGVEALLFNCTSYPAIEGAVAQLGERMDLPLGGYPNRFSSVPADWTLDNDIQIQRDESLTEAVFAAGGVRLFRQGAQLIGGCCGIRPSHIKELHRQLSSTTSTLETNPA